MAALLNGPISQIDRFIIGNGQPGPITRQLSSLYFSTADGSNPNHSFWRTPASIETTK